MDPRHFATVSIITDLCHRDKAKMNVWGLSPSPFSKGVFYLNSVSFLSWGAMKFPWACGFQGLLRKCICELFHGRKIVPFPSSFLVEGSKLLSGNIWRALVKGEPVSLLAKSKRGPFLSWVPACLVLSAFPCLLGRHGSLGVAPFLLQDPFSFFSQVRLRYPSLSCPWSSQDFRRLGIRMKTDDEKSVC